jgi:hypothetical protein
MSHHSINKQQTNKRYSIIYPSVRHTNQQPTGLQEQEQYGNMTEMQGDKENTLRYVLEPSFEGDLVASGAYCPDLKDSVHPAAGVVFDDGKGGRLIGRVTKSASHNVITVNVCPLVDYTLLKNSSPSKDEL